MHKCAISPQAFRKCPGADPEKSHIGGTGEGGEALEKEMYSNYTLEVYSGCYALQVCSYYTLEMYSNYTLEMYSNYTLEVYSGCYALQA